MAYLLSACATLNAPATLSSALTSFCFTSSGKGRLQTPQNRHIFNYESLQDTAKQLWHLEASLPLGPFETLTLDYSKALKNKASTKGELYDRLHGTKNQKILDSLLLTLGQLMALKTSAHPLSAKIKWEQEGGQVKIFFPRGIELTASRYIGFYKKIKVALPHKATLTLYISSCSM